jgi:hypothetical protein
VFHQDEKVLVEHKEGLSAFLASTSIYSSFITSTILRRADWEQLQDHDRYMDSSFNQIYVQYALLANNPNFCVVHSNMFSYAGNPSTGYNFGRVFIDSYQRILADFVDLGLTAEDIRVDKQRVFYNFILPYYSKFATEGATKIIEGFEDYFTAHYKDEVYYEEALKVIQAIHTA